MIDSRSACPPGGDGASSGGGSTRAKGGGPGGGGGGRRAPGPRPPSLGPRGGGWVAIQFVLMAAIVGAGFLEPRWPEAARDVLRAAGAVLVVAGGAFAVAAGRALGSSLTPFPRPSTRGGLVEAGPYRLVRHPIYGAALLVFAGFSLFARVPALALTAGLPARWAPKARV